VLESVAGLPGLLARVDPADIRPAAATPDEAMFERLLARSADERARSRPGPRRRLVLAAAAAMVLTAGGGWALHELRPDDGTRIVTASSGPVHATVRVTPTPSGTSVRLELSGVQAEQRCRLVAVDRNGNRTVAATWEAGYTGTAAFAGSVPVPVGRLASLRVETDTATLLTFPLS
jgi:hypothetical protein